FVCIISLFLFFFFFSSRRRHTRFDCDWSSDVCSSDLASITLSNVVSREGVSATSSAVSRRPVPESVSVLGAPTSKLLDEQALARSEERRVGKECRCRWERAH